MLLLGHGISNDGVKKYLDEMNIKYDYLELKDVDNFNYKRIIKSPAIKLDEPYLIDAKNKGIEIITDIELAYRIYKKNMICVTGTNGKTTVVTLINKMLDNSIMCANIGLSVFDAFKKSYDKYILELSSFELECIKSFKPHIAIITNLSSSHLDHHKDISLYHQSKLNLIMNMDNNDILIYNYDDYILKENVKNRTMIKIAVSLEKKVDCYIKNKAIYYFNTKIIKLKKIKIVGNHNIYNIMMSICAAILSGASKKRIRYEIKNFNGVPFRLQKIAKRIYNDAKSTNVSSTIEALKNFKNVILICGGKLRGEKYDRLKPYLKRIKLVLCYGEAKDKIEKFMMKNKINVLSFDTLEGALSNIKKFKKRRIVLFSPFHSSKDQFENYIKRGELFNKLCLKSRLIKEKT